MFSYLYSQADDTALYWTGIYDGISALPEHFTLLDLRSYWTLVLGHVHTISISNT